MIVIIANGSDINRIKEDTEEMKLLSRNTLPETGDTELVQSNLDETVIVITTDMGPFEKSFEEENAVKNLIYDQKDQEAGKDITSIEVEYEKEFENLTVT